MTIPKYAPHELNVAGEPTAEGLARIRSGAPTPGYEEQTKQRDADWAKNALKELALAGVFARPETPESVGRWVTETFPEYQSTKARTLAVVEEAVELAYAAGCTPDEIYRTVTVPLQKNEDRGEPGDLKEEAADVLLNIYALAYLEEFDPEAVLDLKMKLNRSRDSAYYAAKMAQKRALGMPLDPAK